MTLKRKKMIFDEYEDFIFKAIIFMTDNKIKEKGKNKYHCKTKRSVVCNLLKMSTFKHLVLGFLTLIIIIDDILFCVIYFIFRLKYLQSVYGAI